METVRHCRECGLAIPNAEVGERCPHCLFRLALSDEARRSENSEGTTAAPCPRPRYFGGYELLSEIARGGMGVVWKARQVSVNRFVALKVIPAGQLASPEARLRFRMEIETIGQLDHPNIISLYEAGEHEGAHFFTMRLVEGGNLADWLAARGFSSPTERSWLEHAVRTLVKICHAVHYAHQRGILHRDLKPSNVLIDAQGEPHVADFGLAKLLTRDAGLTCAQSVLGSPNYIAPEQASARYGQLTVAADVHSLGAILYEILTGRPPFQAESALETLRQVVERQVSPPRQLNAGIDGDVETICLKCLEKEPGARYGSAEELAEDLERWLARKPILARPIGAVEQLWRWCRRQPALAATIGISVILLLALVAGTSIAAVRIARAERKAVGHLRESLLDQARALRLSADMGTRKEGLRLIRESVSLKGPPEFRQRARDELLATLALTDMEFAPQPQLPATPDNALSLLDPQLQRHATILGGTNLVLRRVSDGRVLQSLPLDGSPVTRVEEFGPTGRFLALRHLDGVSFWDLESGERCFATNGPMRTFSFASDRPLLALEEWQCQVSLWELPSMRKVGHLEAEPDIDNRNGWSAIALSPDGSLLAGARIRGNILELIEAGSGRTRWRASNAAPIKALCWCPIRNRIATASTDGVVTFWRIDSGAPTVSLRNVVPARSLAVNASESLLAVGCEDRTVRMWGLMTLRQVWASPSDSYRVSFHSDGLRLGTVFRGKDVGWLDLSRSSEFQEFIMIRTTIDVERCEFSPDSTILAGGALGEIDLRMAMDARHIKQLPVRLPIFGFDPRGDAIYTSDLPGVSRWGLRRDDRARVQLDEQSLVLPGSGWRAFAFSTDGKWFVAANIRSNAAYVYDRTFTNCVIEVGPHSGVDALALSPDRHWLVTGSSKLRDVRVWDLKSRRQVFATPAGKSPRAAFSPDGKWLSVYGDKLELREAGSWKPARPLPLSDSPPLLGAAAFSPDKRLLAVVADQHEVQLFDLATWQFISVLRPPLSTAGMNALVFSPDGTRLAAACAKGRLRIWNLHGLRQQLADFGLDWELPRVPL